ncbi:hypothetical protein [uncultured Arcticibacterium sp.]|uniref:hypothetical protein n=1 Tax=uncultured Arcticibacterium sp. TaxID=2173042 RepID=UPI0030F620FD
MELESNTERQVSTKELMSQFFDFLDLLASKWRIWLAALLIGASLSLTMDFFVEKESLYRSTIIFNLELGGGSGQSQLGGLASTFGIFNQNTASGGDLFTAQNFPTLLRSRAVMERALMKTVVVNGDSLLMINYIADSSNIKTNEWGGSLFRKPFQAAIDHKFEDKDINEFSELENLMVNAIYDKVKETTSVELVETTSSIMVLTAKLTNEMLVKKWVEAVLETTEEFYVEMKTKKTRELLKTQIEQLNKIEADLTRTDSRMARLSFENPNVVDPRGTFNQTQVQRQSSFLSTQYVAQLNTIKGLERVIIEQTPIFTIVEETRLPLEREDAETGLNLKLSSLALLVLTIIVISLADSYKKIMQD